jgi:hypothetical protein
MAVDAGDGGRANQVYLFCRGRHKAHAVKGMPGWGRAAIGTPTQVGITRQGQREVRGRTMLWPVGTWDLKAEFYANLRKDGRKRDGQEQDPPGLLPFRQVLATRRISGRSRRSSSPRRDARAHVKVWQDTGPNHLSTPRLRDGDRRQARPEPHDARAVAEARADEEAADGEGRSLRPRAGSSAEGRRDRNVKPATVEEKALSADLSRSVATKASVPMIKRKTRFTRFQGGRRLN